MLPSKNLIYLILIFLTPLCRLSAENSPFGLDELEKALARDLRLINYPPSPIKEAEKTSSKDQPIYDVVIIGAGMAGLAAGAALFKEGIFHIQLFDQNPEGLEGPWLTYARMKTLRSGKDDMGPALDIPHLTFHAWYEAQYGEEGWEQLDKIPTQCWMDYLIWFKNAMHLPVENECRLSSINPGNDYYTLDMIRQGRAFQVKALKVVLATGRAGFGGPRIPAFVQNLPKEKYAHVMESIDFNLLKGKDICVVGGGTSAFDAAATALESGVAKVDLILRAACLPCINKFSSLPDHCFRLGYYKQKDEWRWKVMSHTLTCTVPPPIDALKRVMAYKNLNKISDVKIRNAIHKHDKVELETNRGTYEYDFVILGTGFEINGKYQHELSLIYKDILLWKDQFPCEMNPCNANLGFFPFLGPYFEMLEKKGGQAPYLKNLYCFNYASIMSHGMLSSDIGSISFGAKRLAEGIAQDFIQQQSEIYLKRLEDYNKIEFDSEEYF